VQKLLVGCLVIVVLCAIALGVGGFLFYRAARPALEQARDYVANLGRLGELTELDRQITNRGTFSAPATGELTEAQIERFVRVQEHMRRGMGGRMREIETKYKGLSEDGSRQPSPSEVFAGLAELAGLFVDARRFQVDALNTEGLSQSEYDWIKARVYEAAGIELASRIDLSQIEKMVRDGASHVGVEAPAVPAPDVPERNRELVKPHLAEMKDWLPLAFFGF
jgi:hypothetical protein